MRRTHYVFTYLAKVPVKGRKTPKRHTTQVNETSEIRARAKAREAIAREIGFHRERVPVAWVTLTDKRQTHKVGAKRGTYPHGDRRKYILEGCHCDRCRAANNAYESGRRKLKAYGKAGNVAATAAREHVAKLMSHGMGYKRIAEKAGVNPKTVYVLVAGRSERGTPPPEQIRKTTSDKLLAVRFDAERPRQLVDALPVWEMVADMMCRGWSQAWIAERLGYRGALQWDETQVEAQTARKMLRLFRSTPGQRVACNRFEQAGITRSINRGEVLKARCANRRGQRKRKKSTGRRTGRGSRGITL